MIKTTLRVQDDFIVVTSRIIVFKLKFILSHSVLLKVITRPAEDAPPLVWEASTNRGGKKTVSISKTVANGLVGQVLSGPLFLNVKTNFILQKVSNK